MIENWTNRKEKNLLNNIMPFCKTQMKLFQYYIFFSGILKLRYKFNLTIAVEKRERGG